jgi:hypothetical protein
VIALHPTKPIYRICLDISVNHVVMNWAEQNQIREGVPLGVALRVIVPRTAGLARLDVANATGYFARGSVDDGNGASWECARVPGNSE